MIENLPLICLGLGIFSTFLMFMAESLNLRLLLNISIVLAQISALVLVISIIILLLGGI